MNRRLNATDLFGHPDPMLHNSESWWSTIFSLLVLYLAKHPESPSLPIKECKLGPKWSYDPIGAVDCVGLTFRDVLVEPKLTEKLISSTWPTAFLNLRPDIVLWQSERKKVLFIENKTLGAAVGKQLQLYLDVKDYLTGQGWEAEIHLLISLGYETEREWKMIEQNSVPLILWEDVLSVIDQIECFRNLFVDVRLGDYYEIA
jgi:hypothetical protein